MQRDNVLNLVWDVGLLDWVRMEQPVIDGGSVTIGGTLTVEATDLDIRNLSQIQDAVLVYGSDDGGTTKRVIKTDASGAVQVDIESLPTVTVQATDLDIRNLTAAADSVTASSKIPLTPSAPAAVSVGLASTPIVIANAARKGVEIINTSNARISLAFDTSAVLDSGKTLFPGGSFHTDEYDFTSVAINGIASVAASNVGVQEFT